MKVSAQEKALLSILRKLFVQRGSGRKESALMRGIDESVKAQVGPVLSLLGKERLVYQSKAGREVIWHPNRAMQGRALEILGAPVVSGDRLIRAVRELR